MTTYEEVQQRIRAEPAHLARHRRGRLHRLEPGREAARARPERGRPGQLFHRQARQRAAGHTLHRGRYPLARRLPRGVRRASTVVLHQAALGSVPRSIDRPLATHDNNVNGFLNMLVAARDAGVPRLVFASSSAVFGDDPMLPKVEERIGRAASPYGLSKHINELYAGVFAYCYGFQWIGPALLQRVRPAPGPRRRLRLGDPGVDRRAAARPDRLHQRRRQRGARLLPRRQRGAGEPAAPP